MGRTLTDERRAASVSKPTSAKIESRKQDNFAFSRSEGSASQAAPRTTRESGGRFLGDMLYILLRYFGLLLLAVVGAAAVWNEFGVAGVIAWWFVLGVGRSARVPAIRCPLSHSS